MPNIPDKSLIIKGKSLIIKSWTLHPCTCRCSVDPNAELDSIDTTIKNVLHGAMLGSLWFTLYSKYCPYKLELCC